LAQRDVRATVVTGDALVGPPTLASLPVGGVWDALRWHRCRLGDTGVPMK
jgi:hypothetical protein